ncbi:MAG: tetratricopeptide repeat protein [Phormidesmis sp. CAN_BIN44]|nr:tetratricopeptide repeat protein [Phormidesmis sp. CAN_BIN44]
MTQVSSRLMVPFTLALASAVLMTGCDETAEMVAPSSQKSFDLELSDPTYYVNLGAELRVSQKLEDAIAAYRKAIQIDFRNTEAYQGLGNTLYDQKRLEEAIAVYTRAIQIDADNAQAYCGLGNALLDQKRPEAAIAPYRKAIKLNPGYAVAYVYLGDALSDQKRLNEASFTYQKALDLPNVKKPKFIGSHALAHNGLGLVLQRQGKMQPAIQHYQQALQSDLTCEVAGDNLKRARQLLAKQLSSPNSQPKQNLDNISNVSWVLLLRSLKTVSTART